MGPLIYQLQSLFGWEMSARACFQLHVCEGWQTEALGKPRGKKRVERLDGRHSRGEGFSLPGVVCHTWQVKVMSTWAEDVATGSFLLWGLYYRSLYQPFQSFSFPIGPLLITLLCSFRSWPCSTWNFYNALRCPGSSVPHINCILKTSYFITLCVLGFWVGLVLITGGHQHF